MKKIKKRKKKIKEINRMVIINIMMIQNYKPLNKYKFIIIIYNIKFNQKYFIQAIIYIYIYI